MENIRGVGIGAKGMDDQGRGKIRRGRMKDTRRGIRRWWWVGGGGEREKQERSGGEKRK